MIALLATLFSEAPQAAPEGLFSGLWDSLGSIDLTSMGMGGKAAALAVVWYFVRIVRALVGILFMTCLLVLVLHLTGYADISAIWQVAGSWLGKP